MIADFAGNGAAVGGSFVFVGFGTTAQGVSEVGATNQWQIHSGLDALNEIVTLQNNAAVHASDYLFLSADGYGPTLYISNDVPAVEGF